ncbi:MAG: ATP-binding cassette domain-containing protein [Myxococcaceae bacterium]|nr:ATP-binding cassette domain-containing protein [Myxococcaceae bacterium]
MSGEPRQTDPPLLSTEALTGGVPGRILLEEITTQIRRGECLVLMGPSGAGKTVLLKHLIGLMRPVSGTVRVDGVDFWSLSPAEQVRTRQRYGFAFQQGALFDSLSVFDNVAFPLRRHTQLSEERIAERVRQCLHWVQLRISGRESISELSIGMRRRVGFARAIALEPEILLFDEPTAGLDPVMVTVMSQLINSLKARLRPATVVVTHDLACARDVADRIALLVQRRIVAEAPRDVFFDLTDPVVRQFVEGKPFGPLLPPEELLERPDGEQRP